MSGLQESEKRFSTIFHSSPVGMAITRFTDGRYLDVNREFLSLMGYEREEVVGQTSASLRAWVRPEERAGFVAQLLEKQRVLERTARFRKKNDDIWIARLSAEVIEVDGESVILSLLQDVTEKQRAEEAMARLAAIVETADEAIMGETPDGIITSWNKGAERLFGFRTEEILGRPASLLVPAGREREFSAILELVARGDRIQPFDTERVRKDGTAVEVSMAVSPILDTDGNVVATATILRDVSARRRAEAEILKLNADLEKRVEERTEALIEANRRLEGATKTAEQANAAKSSFLATMSHEIRTPMNAVIGFTNLALRTNLTAQQKDYLSKIYSAGVSLLALINDILDFSKIEAGRLEVEGVDFFLQTVVDQVTSINGNGAFAKGLEFLVDVSPDIPPSLVGDPNRLSQILTNLVGNAVKFTRRGEIQLNITVLETTGDKVKLRFSVRDSGVGMTEEQVSRLFQPFAQADASITRKFGGTGLGLSIVRRLVELMGGQIWAESTLNAGSLFTFTVWLGVSDKRDARPSLPGQLEGMRVLVADDNVSAALLMMEMLKSLRFRVEVVHSGEGAVEAVHRADATERFGLVLMDWKMPGIDGTEATRRILEPRWVLTPPVVVLLSAFLDGEEGRRQAMGAGASEFLQKPVTPSNLLNAVLRIFSPQHLPPSLSEEVRVIRKLQGARILLVEDNEMNQQIANELLQSEGARVAIAGSGREALEKLSREPGSYDLVLMDIQMPDMDGYAAARHIRSQAWGKHIPVIAMTAHALEEERQAAFQAGMDDHIGKPIDPEAMFQVIRKHFKGASQPTALPFAEGVSIPSIEGVAVADGLRRAGGNQRLYFDLLRRFVARQRTTAFELRRSLTLGSTDEAERMAHSLNGLAGNLGLMKVHSAAADLERRIREKQPAERQNEGVDRLSEAYDAVAASILRALPEQEAPVSTSFTLAEGQEAVEKLVALLAANDGESLEYFESVFEKLRSRYSWVELETIQRNLRNFDFDLALDSLEKGQNA